MLVGATPGVAQKGTCAVKAKPSGKVLQGHWENWDGAPTARPTARIRHSVGFRSPTAASRATAVKVPTPVEMCEAKGAGLTTLMSIGGATAGIGLGSSAVADRFVDTVVPILKEYNFDGIDIETGLTGSGDINQLSTSQVDLIRIIDGRLPAHCEEVRGQRPPVVAEHAVLQRQACTGARSLPGNGGRSGTMSGRCRAVE